MVQTSRRTKRSITLGLANSIDGVFKRSVECPGDGWSSDSTLKNASFWIKDSVIKRCVICPGDDWIPHSINKGKKRWANKEGKVKYSFQCPVDGWD